MGIHYHVFPSSVWSPSSPSSTAVVLSAWRGQCGQRPTSIGRVLYVERLTAGSMAAARKCLLITRKIIIPPPDSWDPPDEPPYFAKKCSPLTAKTHQLHLRTQGSASGQKTIRPLTAGTHQLHLRMQGSAFGQKKRFSPLTAGTHQLHLRTQGSASILLKEICPRGNDKVFPSFLISW